MEKEKNIYKSMYPYFKRITRNGKPLSEKEMNDILDKQGLQKKCSYLHEYIEFNFKNIKDLRIDLEENNEISIKFTEGEYTYDEVMNKLKEVLK